MCFFTKWQIRLKLGTSIEKIVNEQPMRMNPNVMLIVHFEAISNFNDWPSCCSLASSSCYINVGLSLS